MSTITQPGCAPSNSSLALVGRSLDPFPVLIHGDNRNYPMTAADIKIDFDAPASLRKWPSIRNERRNDAPYPSPYLVQDGTLFECIELLLSKPASQHLLYE